MNNAIARAWVLVGLCAVGCRKAPATLSAAARNLPKGDAIWLTDPAAADAPELERELQRLGASALFLPAGELAFEAGRWSLRAALTPAHPFERLPVVLVVRPDAQLSSVLESSAGADPSGIAHAILAPLSGVIVAGGPYGRVAGIHVDFSFTLASARRYAELVAALKRGLPPEAFVSLSLRSVPASDAERKQFETLRAAADAFVAFVFGAGAKADPNATDALRRPWWAGYDATASGELTGADGRRGRVAEAFVDRLSGNPRVDFANDLSVNDATFSAFNLAVREPVRLEGLALEPGDRIAFRVPSLAEMLFQLGSNLAGKRFALGRVVLFGGASEADRLFPIEALEDVLLGRALSPILEVTVQPLGRNAIVVDAANRAHHASITSRVANWVEIDLAPAHPADVQLGGFDRYEVYDAGGQPVTPGRATRVRLFETLVAPLEVIHPARIVVRGALPAGCCRQRTHVISAAGPEIAADWSSPPPTPTPTKAPAKRKRM